MRETARGLLETLVIRVLGVAPGGAFSEFRRIVIQDGSSFAIKDALKEVFPGRFKKVKPAAVELHATLDLLNESLSKVILTADTASGPHCQKPRVSGTVCSWPTAGTSTGTISWN